MQVVGTNGRLTRVVVVADGSLIVEAITLGLRKSGEFQVLGRLNARTEEIRDVLDAAPDVVLVDEMERAGDAVTLISQIRAARSEAAVIVLTSSMESEWLDAIFGAGAMCAISKSTHPESLATLVRETLNGHVVHIYRGAGPSQSSTPNAASAAGCPLTARELEVLCLVANGSTNGDIARELWVAEQTVKFHLSNVYRKLNVANRTEASRYAYLNGLVRTMQPSAAQ
jgi:DNA-binding NarL/FixJ family response regulator